jgi:deaminated glutathione amidase
MKIACLQFSARPLWAEHRTEVYALIKAAAAQGAQFIATPENTTGMGQDRAEQLRTAPLEAAHPLVADFSTWAREFGVWLLCGSAAVRNKAGDARLRNRSLLFNPKGEIVARYDKIHRFDAELGAGESYKESAAYDAGERAVLAQAGGFTLGLTICYDLRFGVLHRALAKAGANILCVPAAFAVPTGQAHWHVLLRARAIETGCYVLAPAQCGTHAGGRKTYGHALIVDPWGQILADAGQEPGFITATLDLARVTAVRAQLPCLGHDRDFALPT